MIVKKTQMFEPKHSMNSENHIYKALLTDDIMHIESVVGLIRFALNIPDNVPLRSSHYKLTSESEPYLILNKDVAQQTDENVPNIISNIGVDITKQLSYDGDGKIKYLQSRTVVNQDEELRISQVSENRLLKSEVKEDIK